MQGKVALEEHFATEDTLMDSAGFVPGDYWTELQSRLLDIQDKRLKLMDKHGIETMILSPRACAARRATLRLAMGPCGPGCSVTVHRSPRRRR